MKIAVTTPSGHVGSAAVDFLLDFGGDIQVKLLARRSKDLDRFVRRGAELVIGSQDDADFLVSATQDVDALFWVTPPGYGSDNVRAFQNRLGIAGSFAIRANNIPRVVNLSSIGAQLSSGVGPICGLYDVEGILDEAADNITHLRPGFFFENFLMQLDSITKWGRISLPLSGSRSYPMIAARDIGRVAAMRLSDPTWKGMYIRELHGPADMSFDEAAEIISQVLGRKILFIRSDKQEARHVLLNTGMSENLADLLLEMYDAVESGRLQPLQPRSLESTTPTTLTEFVHEVMLPLIAQPVAH
jgi:uncharacterized protein YbjT (DUF2867 family)